MKKGGVKDKSNTKHDPLTSNPIKGSDSCAIILLYGSVPSNPIVVLTDCGIDNGVPSQNDLKGIAIDPSHHPDFDMSYNKDHDSEELKYWCNQPFIITKTWNDIEVSFEADRAFLRTHCLGDCSVQQEKMDREKRTARADWFDIYPYGVRYEVRCFDGLVADQATVWGTEGTLKAAIRRAIEGPPWCRRKTTTLNMGRNN